ncbi:hypothetical protein [Hymenobacter terrenus]|uniref:hypothetical protein n=1 Tax=Hymenobacter terrenus TaxID=1629124 RepID=UPI00061921C0|nr:hypothetical protein [Hymenobacter terrenus]
MKPLYPVVAALPTLPAGPDRTKQDNELRKSNDRREELVARQQQSGSNKLLERELNQALIAAQVPVVQDLIAQVTAHRATVLA